MKFSNPQNCKIAPRFILAMVNGNSSEAKDREKQLLAMNTYQNVRTGQFTYTKESAWGIVDTILGIPPTELCHVQDELDRICDPLPVQFPTIKMIFSTLVKLLGFKFLIGTPHNVSSEWLFLFLTESLIILDSEYWVYDDATWIVFGFESLTFNFFLSCTSVYHLTTRFLNCSHKSVGYQRYYLTTVWLSIIIHHKGKNKILQCGKQRDREWTTRSCQECFRNVFRTTMTVRHDNDACCRQPRK